MAQTDYWKMLMSDYQVRLKPWRGGFNELKSEGNSPNGFPNMVFQYGYDKIVRIINREIKGLSQDNDKIREQFQADCKVLLDTYYSEVFSSSFVSNINNRQNVTESQARLENKLEAVSNKFFDNAHAIIDKYAPCYEHMNSWVPFRNNLLMLFSVLGTPFALWSFAKKAYSGHYSFFDNKSMPAAFNPLPPVVIDNSEVPLAAGFEVYDSGCETGTDPDESSTNRLG